MSPHFVTISWLFHHGSLTRFKKYDELIKKFIMEHQQTPKTQVAGAN